MTKPKRIPVKDEIELAYRVGYLEAWVDCLYNMICELSKETYVLRKETDEK